MKTFKYSLAGVFVGVALSFSCAAQVADGSTAEQYYFSNSTLDVQFSQAKCLALVNFSKREAEVSGNNGGVDLFERLQVIYLKIIEKNVYNKEDSLMKLEKEYLNWYSTDSGYKRLSIDRKFCVENVMSPDRFN